MYSTAEQVRDVLRGYRDPQERDPDVTAFDLSDAQIEREISNADSEINLVLARRGYVIPVANVVEATDHGRVTIRNISIDLASALSDMVFRGSKPYTDGTNPFRLRWERAKELLELIAQGAFVIDIPTQDNPDGQNPDAGQAVFNAYPGRVLVDEDVFPRGFELSRNGAEYAEDESLIIRPPRYRRY